MRYTVAFYPMLGDTLAVVNSNFESYERGTIYKRFMHLKTEGDGHWPLPQLLRELADQLEASD